MQLSPVDVAVVVWRQLTQIGHCANQTVWIQIVGVQLATRPSKACLLSCFNLLLQGCKANEWMSYDASRISLRECIGAKVVVGRVVVVLNHPHCSRPTLAPLSAACREYSASPAQTLASLRRSGQHPQRPWEAYERYISGH